VLPLVCHPFLPIVPSTTMLFMCAFGYHGGIDHCSRCLCRHMDATNMLALIHFGYRNQIELIPIYSAHLTGIFLPWHRLYLHTMERLLREKCGYKGYMTYWDWTIGRSDISQYFYLKMLMDMVFCQIHTTSSMHLFLTLTLWSVLGHFQILAPISPSVTGPFMISSAHIP